MGAITRFFPDINHVYAVEILVFAGIVGLLLFVFYELGLLKKPG